MKVALVHTPLVASTGGERQVLRLATELQSRGHDVDLFTSELDERSCHPQLIDQVQVTVEPPRGFERLVRRACGRIDRIVHLGPSIGKFPERFPGLVAAEGDYDVINFHNYGTHWAAPKSAREGIPSVWMCNEPPFWWFNPAYREPRAMPLEWPFFHGFDRWAAEHLDEIVVLDSKNVDRVQRIYDRTPTIVRSGVDVDAFLEADAGGVRDAAGIPSGFTILQVGSPAAYKYHEHGLQLLQRVGQVHLVMVGRGLEDAYASIASRLGVRDRVTFMGGVGEDELRQWYKAADVFLFPADQTWGLVVFEAMASGTPAVVADKAGASDVVVDGETGFVYPWGDMKRVAEIVDMLSEDDRLRRRVGLEGQRYVRENMSWSRYAQGMEGIFEAVVDGDPGPNNPEQKVSERLAE